MRDARKRLGLTQAELARLMDLDPNSVARIEQGRRTPPVRYLRLLRAYLDGYRPSGWPEGR